MDREKWRDCLCIALGEALVALVLRPFQNTPFIDDWTYDRLRLPVKGTTWADSKRMGGQRAVSANFPVLSSSSPSQKAGITVRSKGCSMSYPKAIVGFTARSGANSLGYTPLMYWRARLR